MIINSKLCTLGKLKNSVESRERSPMRGTNLAGLLEQHFHHLLTDRELEAGKFAVQRISTQDIAERMFVSISTVKSHLKNVFRKTQTRNRNVLHQKLIELAESEGDVAASTNLPRPAVLHPLIQSSGRSSLDDLLPSPLFEGTVSIGLVDVSWTASPAQHTRALLGVAAVLTTSLRPTDRIIQWRDNQFLLIMEKCSTNQTQAVMARMVSKISTWSHTLSEKPKISVSVASTDEGVRRLDVLAAMAEARL